MAKDATSPGITVRFFLRARTAWPVIGRHPEPSKRPREETGLSIDEAQVEPRLSINQLILASSICRAGLI